MSFTFLNQLPTPEEIKRDYPLTPELAELKKQRDTMISVFLLSSDHVPRTMKILFATMSAASQKSRKMSKIS